MVNISGNKVVEKIVGKLLVNCCSVDGEALARVLSGCFCGISGSAFSAERLRTTASVNFFLISFCHSIVFFLIISYTK